MDRVLHTSSPYDTNTLEYFKKLLLDKREKAVEQLEMTRENINNLNEDNDPDFMPASDVEEASSEVQRDAMNYQLLERNHSYIKKIDEALQRIENGTYGICKATGKAISKGRLEAVPHTEYSIEAKNKGLDQ